MREDTPSASSIAPPEEEAETSSELLLFPGLPNDVGIQCLARTPRWTHPAASVVSKSWRSVLQCPTFFATRSALSSAQHTLYLSIRTGADFNWFALLNPQNPKSVLQLPRAPSNSLVGAAHAVLGSKIYVVGGSHADVASSNVWIFDCRFNCWEIGPRMRVGREFAAAGVVDGKLYVMGGCVVDTWAKGANWAEVFDPEVRKWAPVSSPVEIRNKWMHASAVIDGRVYALADRGGIVYDPEEKSWEAVETQLDLGWRGRATVIDNVMGLGKDLPKFLSGATMANRDGRLVVVWEGAKSARKVSEIWCAEISVWKDGGNGELRGSVDWSDVVLSVPSGSSIVHCLTVKV
uniref:Uncharacterized protein n=1 Tax=Kalanchoe fedtschenkoi TaxID=63787 RepID=A0A7N0TX86_KALFE